MADLYLYEFLWRGRAAGSDQPADYHVILAQDFTDAFGGSHTSMTAALTPNQASVLGFDITKIVAAVNAGTMAENDNLKARLDGATADRTALQAKLDAAGAAAAGMQQQIETAASETKDLKEKLEAASAELAALKVPAEPDPAPAA